MKWQVVSHGTAAVFALALSAALLSGATNEPPFQPRLPDPALWPQGRYVYQRNCLVCHGTHGDGTGEMGRTLKPPPRNFGRGVFKYRSTPPGALPTDDDLERTIRGGLAGTAMPVFSNLSEREIKSVIEYVKSFSRRWHNPTPTASTEPKWPTCFMFQIRNITTMPAKPMTCSV